MPRKTNFKANGKEYYRVTRTIGHKPDGTPIKKQFYGSGVNEANQKADEYIANIKEFSIKDVSISDIMDKWIYEVKKYDDIKPSTYMSYEGIYRNYIKANEIGDFKLSNTKSITLQEQYNEMSKNGISGSILRKTNKLLYQFFEYCIKEDYISLNPASNIKIPKLENEKKLKEEIIEYFSEDEISKIKKALVGDDLELIVLFALGTGMRQGELLALRYSDIDYENKQVNVNRSVKQVSIYDENNISHTETVFSTPKTSNSKRTIDIPDTLFNKLPHKNTNELVFSDNGNVIEARKLYRHWKNFLIKNNIPYKKFHSLRHTYATLLLTNDVDLLTVSKLLGHSSIQITEIYSHIIPSKKTQAVNKINYIF